MQIHTEDLDLVKRCCGHVPGARDEFNKIAGKAYDVFDKLKIGAKKTYAKINVEARLLGLRNELGKSETGLGKICYGLVLKQNLAADNKDIKIYVDKITKIKEEIDKLENGYFICPCCGELHEPGTEYCPKKGEKIFK
jgi:hypothetical protein